MIVRGSIFQKVVEALTRPGMRAIDTETTGLRAYHGDRLFSIIIADSEQAYYFNFANYPDLTAEWVLPRAWLVQLQPIFGNLDSLWFLANAKFDMGMLAAEDLHIKGAIHCVEALGRIEKNNEFKYGLDALAKRIGLEKSDIVEDYIKKHRLYEPQFSLWKTLKPKKLFAKVPFRTIVPYGEQDARVTLAVGLHQVETLQAITQSTPEGLPQIAGVLVNERQFTKTCFKMEQTGIQIDLSYCEQALRHAKGRCMHAASEFERLTGTPFQDSNKLLANAFTKLGVKYPLTEKGNPSFNDKALQSFDSPVANLVKDYREAHKNANTYYANFLYFADDRGIVHPSIKQGAARTGRISVVNPALQTVPDEEEVDTLSFAVRRAFVPRPGHLFVMIDYDQQEYRLMLDYAGQMDLIEEVKNGMDLHQATVKIIAQVTGVNLFRTQAKTLNFGLLYGMGKDALANALKVSVVQAKQLKYHYFQALPFVKGFIQRVITRAESQGYIFNWYGRRYYFTGKDAYKAPNALCQGGAGDIMKVAMNRIDAFLEPYQSKMLLSIHDEILFEMVPDELFLVPELKKIMEDVYPYRHLKLTCSIEHSFKSWGDKVKGLPDEFKARDAI